MCPSFSLCACRILKMRSCLRRPLVPAMSRPRASLPSSAILCSFSSEIVMLYLEVYFFRRDCMKRRRDLRDGGGRAEGQKRVECDQCTAKGGWVIVRMVVYLLP